MQTSRKENSARDSKAIHCLERLKWQARGDDRYGDKNVDLRDVQSRKAMSCENQATSGTSIPSHSQTLPYQQSRSICVGGGQPGARGSLPSQGMDSLGALESGRLTTLSPCDRSPLFMIG